MNQFLKYVINSFINTDQSKCHHKFHKILNIFKRKSEVKSQTFFKKAKFFEGFLGKKTTMIYKQ